MAANKGRDDYRDPVKFFSRTGFTRALGEHMGMVLRRLAGRTEDSAPVMTLVTQFAGGKTHADGTVPSGKAWKRCEDDNELWCTGYRREFLLGNRQYCYPLTVTDQASRFLLTYEALSSTRENYAFAAFERLFRARPARQHP